MEIADIRNQLTQMNEKIISFRGSLDLDQLEEDIAEAEHQMADPTFWDDSEKAQQVINANNTNKETYDQFNQLAEELEELEVMLEMIQEEADPEMEAELEARITKLNEKMASYELSMLLDEPYDRNNAIIELHPGAGGTESQDWGSMLLRMYTRFCEQHGYQVETLDYQAGDEAGIKSVTLLVKGHNAYGYLKSEKGVHRLVRISPFDSAKRRHTSFCSVDVMPELDGAIDVEINSDDLKIDTYRASGAGGQHINKTESAVRITHIPTGTVVASQAQRSQLKNREQAMGMLKAKLYQLEVEKKEQEAAALRGEQLEIGWGSQIRSYVFHPYSMVKDHRTNFETGNVQAVMDGDLDGFIDAYLKLKLNQK
ncbi:peptide chain release factor 2 [Enterococcus casseliflavus]|uniref:Peptide chain release factor 2 n=1 Tax=Enterococcus casseliflavus TaxID=37734 RepID=A0ABD6Z4E4_ENTCA|nr:peptide chain release factor 2 [Enterococcus casseliflavus]MBE9880525.1 peptide chain release factor 2 [Enterococcus casseliflavus]MDT2974133.1 peptide chain release factor 2 [Enterococcus casseliflavus]QGN30441.1 peptide chain release factor 2 [Enterococcus casseliflavus]QQB85852.1 peptide chain release factor 2 [Enterococcus casseliflavus]